MRSRQFIYPHLSIVSYEVSESFQSQTQFHDYFVPVNAVLLTKALIEILAFLL